MLQDPLTVSLKSVPGETATQQLWIRCSAAGVGAPPVHGGQWAASDPFRVTSPSQFAEETGQLELQFIKEERLDGDLQDEDLQEAVEKGGQFIC